MQRNHLSKCAAGVCLVAAVLFAYLSTRTEAAVLRKTASRGGWTKATGLRKGIIVFGEGPKNASSDDSYQSDFPGFVQGKVMDPSSKEAQWRRMSPLLLCGLDKMKFRANGSPVNSFALDKDPLMPLSSVPADCGYNMQQNLFGLVLNVPYHGCHVVNEDAFYSLPLNWNGISVTLKCPKSQQSTTTAAPQDPVSYPWPIQPQVPATASPKDPAHPQVPQELLQLIQLLLSQLAHIPNLPTLPQDPALWMAYASYLLQLLQNQGQSTTPTPQDPMQWNLLQHQNQGQSSNPLLQQDLTQWNAYSSDILQSQGPSTPPLPQDPTQWYAYLLQNLKNKDQSTNPQQQDPTQWYAYMLQLLQNQGQSTTTTTPPPPQDPSQWYAYMLQNQGQSTTTTTPPPPQDPSQWYAYMLQLLQNQGQSTTTTTPPPSQDSSQWYAYMLQLLQNQGQSTTTTTPSSPQDPTQWNSYCYHLLQLLLSQAQSTPAPQDPQMPHNLPPHYIYHLLGLQHQHMEPTKTPAPNVPQNTLQSPFDPFQKYPWVYSQPTVAPKTLPPPSPWYDPQQGKVPVWYQQGQAPLFYPVQNPTSAPPKAQDPSFEGWGQHQG